MTDQANWHCPQCGIVMWINGLDPDWVRVTAAECVKCRVPMVAEPLTVVMSDDAH